MSEAVEDTVEDTDWDAVVIGSGFGGAVSACRLAQAGQRVLVLERGRRYPRGSFSRDYSNLDAWLWSAGRGLYDIQPLSGMLLVSAAGVGGGSLVYANVQMRAAQDVFASGWPEGYDRAALDPYYDLVAHMLDVAPITAAGRPLPAKTGLMADAATKLGRRGQLFHPNLAITYGDPDVATPNRFGVSQPGCSFCGECDAGCNTGAKNTLDTNYLAVAEAHGAQIVPLAEVDVVTPGEDGGYTVRWRDHADGGRARAVFTAQVFICAGALGSTELLLRCRDQYGTMPDLSPALGEGYSGNGDFLAFGHDVPGFAPADGPTITTATVYTNGDPRVPVWFLTEDGGYPPQLARLLAALDPGGWLGRFGRLRDDVAEQIRARTAVPTDPEEHPAVLLLMGRDRAEGRLRLLNASHDVRVEWDLAENLPLYSDQDAVAEDFVTALGGRYTPNPLWSLLHQPVSVHNLGGATMADDPDAGVVDGLGRVHRYPGLFILDGAIIPTSLGANPSHTIAAVAERCIEQAIRDRTAQLDWTAPERALAVPVVEPLDGVDLGTPQPPRATRLGLRFTERMAGTWTAMGGAERPMEFTVTIATPQLDTFLNDPLHPASAQGMVVVDGITPPGGSSVVAGLFHLMAVGDAPGRRTMLYALPFRGDDGELYLLDGHKEVWDHGGFDIWGATTTLYVTLHHGGDTSAPVLGTGTLYISVPDFAHQLTTFRISGARSPWDHWRAVFGFGRVFLGGLLDTFVRPRLGLPDGAAPAPPTSSTPDHERAPV